MPVIAHMQIADVPARNEPGTGEIGWEFVFRRMDELGYAAGSAANTARPGRPWPASAGARASASDRGSSPSRASGRGLVPTGDHT